MPNMRPYVDSDWKAVLDLCLSAFAPVCESLERLRGADLDWRRSIRRHLRSLIRPAEGGQLIVAELRGSIVGFVAVPTVHYHMKLDRSRARAARRQPRSLGPGTRRRDRASTGTTG